jgi:hypothetical protein
MNKLQILFGLSSLLVIVQLFYFLSQLLFFKRISALFLKDTDYTSAFQNPRWWVVEIVFSLLLGSSIFISKAFWGGIKKGLFNKKAVSNLKVSSILLLILGLGTLLYGFFDGLNSYEGSSLFLNFMVSVLIIMLGYLLLLFVDVIQKGIYLKKENDLTI